MAVKYNLVSTSTDGKILIWRYLDKLRFPIKGHLLARKKGAETLIIGGTSCDKVCFAQDTTYIVGTEGGSIFKCGINDPTENDVSHFFDNTGCRWKHEAMSVLGNLPSKSILEVKKRVERYVMDKGEKDVWAPTVFGAKPDIRLLYPIPFNANYEKHLGPVTGVSCSPFFRRVFLTCSTDGTIRLYDVLNHKPSAIFEPGYNEYLTDVCWSPFRPTVFVTISNSGTVYIYDLILSKQAPSYVLDYQRPAQLQSDKISKHKTAYSMCFNPRQRDFLAIGYHDGTTKIYRLNYSLSNPKKNEIKVLKSFLEEKDAE